jgi:hypothetical protein
MLAVELGCDCEIFIELLTCIYSARELVAVCVYSGNYSPGRTGMHILTVGTTVNKSRRFVERCTKQTIEGCVKS